MNYFLGLGHDFINFQIAFQVAHHCMISIFTTKVALIHSLNEYKATTSALYLFGLDSEKEEKGKADINWAQSDIMNRSYLTSSMRLIFRVYERISLLRRNFVPKSVA